MAQKETGKNKRIFILFNKREKLIGSSNDSGGKIWKINDGIKWQTL